MPPAALQRFAQSSLFKRTVLEHIARDLLAMHFAPEASVHGATGGRAVTGGSSKMGCQNPGIQLRKSFLKAFANVFCVGMVSKGNNRGGCMAGCCGAAKPLAPACCLQCSGSAACAGGRRLRRQNAVCMAGGMAARTAGSARA